MTNIQLNIFNTSDFKQILASAQLEYHSDISWGYRAETKEYCIDFYQDETGRNHIGEFSLCKKGLWIAVQPTRDQTRLMFEKLNDTPYRDVEPEYDSTTDYYDEYGVRPEMFY